MILVDKEIEVFCQNGNKETELEKLTPKDQTAIFDSVPEQITNIGYDLRADAFYKNGQQLQTDVLLPGESVIVSSAETVHLDAVTTASVQIKNSRLRMGLTLDAPRYQPGHTTAIYFRITNLSDSSISLEKGQSYATLIFEQLHTEPEKPYDGTFQKEFSYKGLADYSSAYKEQIENIDGKLTDLKELEKRLYGNVVTILTVFIAIFALINVNVTLVQSASAMITMLAFNLALIGAFSFFALFMNALFFKSAKNKPSRLIWFIPLVCFALVALIAIF